MRWPIAVEPVNDTMSMSDDAVSAAAGAASAPVITLTTPGGNPTSCMISARTRIASGSCGAGLTTTVQPTASAGAILPATLVSGKLYGEMHATAPTGSRLTCAPMSAPGASGVLRTGDGGSAIPMSLPASRE